jgi:GMP synthase-like glutamine amidotransferase
LILTGSGLSVNEEEVHVEKFGKMLKVALEKNKQLKVIGLCFGHQLLAKIYEG